MRFSRAEKMFLCLSIVIAGVFAVPSQASAMHILEGFIPLGHCIAWFAVCIPFLTMGVIKLRRTVKESKRALILLAMSGAFIFIISVFHVPAVTGSSSHMTGVGIAAILFGFSITSILGFIALAFQALLLAHGGITTLGANTVSMGIMGPIVICLLFFIGKKLKLNRSVNIFIATTLGSFFVYVVTSFQLALAHPSETGGIIASMGRFLAVFAPTQIPISIVEGILTVLFMMGIETFAKKELIEIKYIKESAK